MLDTADIQVCLGTDYESKFACLTLTDIGQCLIVDIVPVFHCLHSLGILTQYPADHTHHRSRLFDIAGGAGQDDNIAFVTLIFHKAQRDRIGDAAVEKLLTADFNNFCDKRHGTGRAEPLQHLPVAVIITQMVDRFACFNVCAYQIELHGILTKRFPVKGI